MKIFRTATRLLAIAAALVWSAGCAHQSRSNAPTPGHDTRPYEALPWYLQPAVQLPPPRTSAGRPSDRIPVAGHWPLPTADARDRIRVLLARLDVAVIDLRNLDYPSQTNIALVQSAIAEVAGLARGRPDLIDESDEILTLSGVLPHATRIDRARAITRILEVTDLIRSQLIATS